MKNTSALIKTLKNRIIFASALEYFLLLITLLVCALVIASIAGYLLAVYLPLKEILLYGTLAWAVYCAYLFSKKLTDGRLSDERILADAGTAHPELNDELISAWQLSKKTTEGISEELTGLLKEKAENSAPAINPAGIYEIFSVRSLKLARIFAGALSVAVLLYFIPPGIMKTTLSRLSGRLNYADWTQWFEVSPGTKQFPWGSAVKIEVTAKQVIKGNPILLIINEDGDWADEELSSESAGNFSFSIEKLVSETRYKIKWGEFRTAEFSLVPVSAPQFGDFTVKYTYPAYTGMGQTEVKGNPSVSALSGTKVTITAKSDKKLKSAEINTSWGAGVIKADGYDITASFTVTKDGAYKITATAVDGSFDPEPEEYSVKVISDQPPKVELLSPAGDLIVAENTEIPLIIHSEDDFGITKVELIFRNGAEKEQRASIDIKKGSSSQDAEYLWRLARLNPKPGDRITYYVEAWDNDTQSGPKSAATEPQTIEINDYTKAHEKIEDELKNVRDDLLGLLADQNEARKKVKSLEVNYSTGVYNDGLSKQQKVREDTKSPLDKLAKSLSDMENDPYCDFSTYSEYKGLDSHLQSLKDKQMPQAVDALKSNDLKEAAKQQDEIIAALEKMSLLSEDIWQYQRMRDLFNSGEDLKKASADLKEQLANSPQADKLNNQLKKLEDTLDKINNQLSKMPHELPEDFVNSKAIKNIDMASYQDTLSKIRDAVSKGDWQGAQKMMEEFEKSMQSLLDNFENAGKDVGFSKNSDDELAQKINNYSAELGSIIESQKSWLEKTRALDETRRKAEFARQEKILKSLYEKQKALNEKAVVIRKDFLQNFKVFGLDVIDQSISLMGKVLEEFKNGRAFNSQKYLVDIINNWKGTGINVVSPWNGADEMLKVRTSGDIRVLCSGEEEILAALKNTGNAEAAEMPDAEKSSALSNEEKNVGAKTFGLHKQMQEFMRKSAVLGPQEFENLSMAGSEMNTAAGQMGQRNSGGAVEEGQKALESLVQGQNGLEEASGKLSEMKGNSGKRVSGVVQARSGGSSGFRSVAVKLPGKDDYKPPKEFRQELMDAMKEKYPEKFDKIIKEYYRRLTE